MSDDRPDDLMAALRASIEAAKKSRISRDERQAWRPTRCWSRRRRRCSPAFTSPGERSRTAVAEASTSTAS
jgi:hypothetical protein